MLLASFLLSCGENPQSQQGAAPPAFPVKVAVSIEREVHLTDVYTGRFAAVDQVELRPRVSGYVESVHFEEGQSIEAGQLMFQIDPRPFDAAAAAAEARLAQAKAKSDLAKSNLDRAEKLLSGRAISTEETENRRSEFAQTEADVLAVEASLTVAKLDRDYADITAPIAGIASRYLVTPGNYVTGGGPVSTLLSTIVSHSPIHCYFEVDERKVLRFTRMYFEGKTKGREGELPMVEIAVSDSEDYEFSGPIDFSENKLDESTATFQLRAIVENENQFLTPGLFAKVRVAIGEPFDAILVKDSALGFDRARPTLGP